MRLTWLFLECVILSVMQYCGCSLFTCPSGPAEINYHVQFSEILVFHIFLTIQHQRAMDGCAKKSNTMSTDKRNDSLNKASSILSIAAILLTIALFVRMETFVHDTKMMDSKFTLEILHIKDALKEVKDTRQARMKENFDALSGK